MTTLRFTILGCGSSGGVPRVGGDWGKCDPANPKNRRRRCSLLIEQIGGRGKTRVLIDTGPDVREQLLDTGVNALDAVFYTHSHADHLHGIDDLRGFALALRRRVPVYMDRVTLARANEAFGYCFEGAFGYPPILDAHEISPGQPETIDGPGGPVTLIPFAQNHGAIDSLGFRVGDLAYSSDLHDLPVDALPHVSNLSVWIIDALRWTTHSSHLNVEQAMEWIVRMKTEQGILTNMHHDLDYEALNAATPPHVVPAYDLMVIERPVAGTAAA
ncbi:MAG: MBL fold metallo-hydrolase [Pseudomonadota bacterium]